MIADAVRLCLCSPAMQLLLFARDVLPSSAGVPHMRQGAYDAEAQTGQPAVVARCSSTVRGAATAIRRDLGVSMQFPLQYGS